MLSTLLLLSAAFGDALALSTPHHLAARANNIASFTDVNGQLVTYANCYTDASGNRALAGSPSTGLNGTAMTVQMCALACSNNGFPISGTEFSGECYCGSAVPTSAIIVSTSSTGCWMACSGDANTICGGGNALSVYSQTLLVNQANVNATDSRVSYVGCGTLVGGGTSLTAYTTGTPTVDTCATLALTGGYKGFSLKQTTCVLYSAIPTITTLVSSCTVPCAGNSLKLCGSADVGVQQIYSISGTNVPSTVTPFFVTPLGHNFTYLGCWTDNSFARTLPVNSFLDQTTPLACVTSCANLGYVYAGVEYGAECWCGNAQAGTGTLIPPLVGSLVQTDCISQCKGDGTLSCGGANAIQIYQAASFSGFSVTPSTNYKAETVAYYGCFSDSVTSRIFPVQITGLGPLTPLLCTKACSAKTLTANGLPVSYPYAGLQYGNECWCSSVAPTTTLPQLSCTAMACAGDAGSWCGGGNKMVVYRSTAPGTPSPITSFGAAVKTGCYLTVPGTTPSQYTVITAAGGASILNVEFCITSCSALGYAWAGLVGGASGSSCQCSQMFTVPGTENGACTSACPAPGFGGEACGGYTSSVSSTSVYKTNTAALVVGMSAGVTSATFGTSLTSASSYVGCYVDSSSSRVLATPGPLGAVLNSPVACIDKCVSLGFTYAGVEYASECWCGNSLPAAWTGSPSVSAFAKPGECNVRACPGATTQACGAGNRLAVYIAGGSVSAPTTQSTVGGFFSVGSGTATAYNILGCYPDNYPISRSLKNSVAVSGNSPTVCATACFNLGYQYAGLEYASECYCGNLLTATISNASPSPCNMPCAGDPTKICGGSNFLTIYRNTGMTPTNLVGFTNGATTWTYAVCWHEPANARALTTPFDNSALKTIQGCLTLAGTAFNTCGIEYGGECWCGNALPVSPTAGYQISEAYCSSYVDGTGKVKTLGMVCTGNSLQWCGAGNVLTIYTTYTPNPAIVPITVNPS